MSIECDMSRVPHSRGVQCGVLLESMPLPLSEKFIQQVTLIFESMTGFEKAFFRRMISLRRSEMSIES